MIISNEEKHILAQHYFEKCFKEWYNLCGVNDFYQVVNGKSIYETGDNEKISEFKEVGHFHVVNFNKFPKETYIKLVKATKNIFAQIGYTVDDTKLVEIKP